MDPLFFQMELLMPATASSSLRQSKQIMSIFGSTHKQGSGNIIADDEDGRVDQ